MTTDLLNSLTKTWPHSRYCH